MRRRWRIRAGWALAAAGALWPLLSCYRPRVVDCVIACTPQSGCPDGTTCQNGLCTRGATCTLEVAAGGKHSCAIRGGQVTCWGSNTYGQLGVPGTGNRGDGTAAPAPADLGGQRAATAIAAGGRHTCAIVVDAAGSGVLCWGDDSWGQLGAAPGSGGLVPFGGGTVVQVTAGLYHSCAQFEDGSVRCWGDNRFGQLGVPRANGAGADASLGSPFPPVDLGGARASAVSAGAYHTCALLDDGSLRCWGWNDYGQLGDVSRPGGDVEPGLILPVDLGGGRRAGAVAAGAFHTCAISDAKEVVCWGQNDAGQTGVPYDPTQRSVPPRTAVDLGSGRTARAIGLGASHTCAVLDDFSTRCWGFNGDGELGVGDTDNRGDNEPLGDALPRVALGPDPVARISAGANHACVTQGAQVKCWGFGAAGRLGTGDDKNRGDQAARPITATVLDRTNP